MPASTVTPVVSKRWTSGPVLHTLGTLSFSVSPDTYTSGGNVVNFGQAAVKTQRVPIVVDFWSQTGYVYEYINGTDITNGKLMIYTGGAAQSPLTELTGGSAIPAAVSSDVINFKLQSFFGM